MQKDFKFAYYVITSLLKIVVFRSTYVHRNKAHRLRIGSIWGQFYQHVYEQLLHAQIPKEQKTDGFTVFFAILNLRE
jgi:hypothetical protein